MRFYVWGKTDGADQVLHFRWRSSTTGAPAVIRNRDGALIVTKNVKNNYRCCFKTAQNENGFVGKNKNQVEKINKKERYTGFFLTKISKNPCVTAFFVLFLNLTSNEKGNEKEKKIET